MAAPSLRVQTVLYHQPDAMVSRFVASVANAAARVLDIERFSEVSLHVGDCSRHPALTEPLLRDLREQHVGAAGLTGLTYDYFDENLGHGGGHNRLMQGFREDLIMFVNPDLVVAPSLLDELLQPFTSPRTGLVEARQIPFEHPKDWDAVTGETSWSAFACVMVRGSVAREVGPFDADSFFLHCDDIDYSWRIRLAGYLCIYHPPARVFHDKRASAQGVIEPSSREVYEGALGMLMLTYKYHRDDVTEALASALRNGSEEQRRAVEEFDRRVVGQLLPSRLDEQRNVANFVGFDVARRKF